MEDIDAEIPCRLCGVSFNVYRYRTEQEPPSSIGIGLCADPEECPDQGGCYFVQQDLPPDEQIKYTPSHVRESNMLDTDHLLEHIAGPNCNQTIAYNGHRISAEDMKGCNTFQCLVYKPEDWQPQSDDQEFEVKGNYFLSGLGDDMPSQNTNWPGIFPARHGTVSLQVDYNDENGINADQYGMPFHPTCLEIFKRVSLYRYGFVDMQGLTLWWTRAHSSSITAAFPREQAVKSSFKDRHWHHELGNEYLAANPCLIPKFQSILQACQDMDSSDSDVTLATISTTVSREDKESSRLLKLPTEVVHNILLYLDLKDLVNLRLTSRLFLQLPNHVLYELTLRLTPWLYEAWSSLPLSFWATTTEEVMGEEWDTTSNFERGTHPDMPVNQLSRTGTNWLHLHAEIARNRDKLSGLRNRRRIWKDCEEILNRVEKLRANGHTTEMRDAD
ncbi:hypothetical protein FPOAC2_05346 [Fusarium poae]|jgi:hypothetical protein|uniref:hypothetical protein n=1 Tax=Fusarium poae TaxID=36050 RepID=UPI001CEB12EA|nr:hypothetical protein FPOAC1_005240 [Fusarium poae]KAG8671981.1 hypothetical protein FPOAC1_005240 [Fusarium poae]